MKGKYCKEGGCGLLMDRKVNKKGHTIYVCQCGNVERKKDRGNKK